MAFKTLAYMLKSSNNHKWQPIAPIKATKPEPEPTQTADKRTNKTKPYNRDKKNSTINTHKKT